MSDEQTKKMEALFGGKVVPVTLRDGSTEEVRVKEIPIRQFETFLIAIEDEAQIISIVTGKDEDWVDNLADESHEALVAAAMDVNFTRVERWLDRKVSRGQQFENNPAVQKALVLQKTLLTLQSSAIAPSTKS